MKLKLQRKTARVELIPLIDIIFLLLVFFIYSMLSMAVYRGIPVVLPRAETVEGSDQEPLFISVDRKENVFVEKEPIERDLLVLRLKQEIAGSPGKVAIISADGDAPYKAFVDVLDRIRQAGFTNVSIEAKPKETGHQ